MKRTIPVSPILADLIGSALASMDGVRFTDLDACPSCGGPVAGHDLRAKRFAVVLDQGRVRTIRVYVKRFYCQTAAASAVPSTLLPWHALARPSSTLPSSKQMPFNRAAEHLRAIGIVVDRGTIRNYASRRWPYQQWLFGFPLPPPQTSPSPPSGMSAVPS